MRKTRMRKLSAFYRETFGVRVHKVGLVCGFGCPGREPLSPAGACSFCHPLASLPATWRPGMSLAEQLEEGMRVVGRRYSPGAFIAYLQDGSATWPDAAGLEEAAEEVLSLSGERLVGIALCTRPDCLGPEAVDVVRRLSRRTWLQVEVGVQTWSAGALERTCRGHGPGASTEALGRLSGTGAHVVAQLVIGLPGSSPPDVAADARELARSNANGVKLHNLHVVRGTRLEEEWRRGEVRLQTMEEYANDVVRFLERVPPGVVVHRLTGEAPRDMTAAPEWSLRKGEVLRRIEEIMAARDTRQGKLHGSPVEARGGG